MLRFIVVAFETYSVKDVNVKHNKLKNIVLKNYTL